MSRLAAALVIGAPWVLVPIVLLLAALAPMADRTSVKGYFLAVVMAIACVLGLIAAIRALGKRRADYTTVAAIAIVAGLYEMGVIQFISALAH